MDKNSIIGFILIGVIFFGFTWYQSNQYKKQREYQAQLDSLAMVEQMALMAAQDSLAKISGMNQVQPGTVPESGSRRYLDSTLNESCNAQAGYVTLSNGKLELVLSTKGAQPYSAKLKDYRAYDSTDLYLVKPGYSDYNNRQKACNYPYNSIDFNSSLSGKHQTRSCTHIIILIKGFKPILFYSKDNRHPEASLFVAHATSCHSDLSLVFGILLIFPRNILNGIF